MAHMKIAMANVFFTPEHIEALQRLAAKYGSELTYFEAGTRLTSQQLEEFDALMGYFPPKLLPGLTRLRWMQVPSAGVDHLQGAFDAEQTILTNSSGAFGVVIGEYLTTGLLMLYKKMPAYLKNQRAHQWRKEGTSQSIFGSLVTVVGLGDIGGSFAERMRFMGARVRGVKRSASEKPEYLEAIYTVNQLAEAVEGADVVALTLPSTRETKGLLSEEIIRHMKPGAVLLNAGRGATVDEAALIQALQEGRLGGAVLDVTAVEPLPADSPLWDMENVILTPHISGSNADPVCVNATFKIFYENLERFLTGKPLNNLVDISQGY
jgi:phosphoglycerate dehydrogenase-like enzyme